MPIVRRVAERDIRQCLETHRDVRDLLLHGGSEGVRQFAQVVHSCVEKLNAEAGLTGPRARLVSNAVMQSALRPMLLFRKGKIRAASQTVFDLWWDAHSSEPLARHRGGPERELEELAYILPIVVFEEAVSATKAISGKDMLRRVSACLGLSFDDVGRMLNVSGETVRRWERGISRIPSDALATLQLVDSALSRLTRLFLPQRLPEVVRRKADLFNGARALDWILQGRIVDVVDRYEQALSYQG